MSPCPREDCEFTEYAERHKVLGRMKKVLVRLGLVALIGYTAVCGVMYFEQDRLLYFPSPAEGSAWISRAAFQERGCDCEGLGASSGRWACDGLFRRTRRRTLR